MLDLCFRGSVLLPLLLLLLALGVLAKEPQEVKLPEVQVVRVVVAKEGAHTELRCNVTGEHEHFQWFNSKGEPLEQEDPGGRWLIREDGTLNITAVSFQDRGRYTCVASGPAAASVSSSTYAITLRVAHGDSGLGLYYVGVCVVAFSITMVLNVARLLMVSGHLRATQRAIDELFRSEGADKLQKALEVAKRIPIITSARTLELAKVTQDKTLELARHIEELARCVPLPPLITQCRTGTTGGSHETDAPRSVAVETRDTEGGETLLPSGPTTRGTASFDVKVAVHEGQDLEI